MKKSSQLLSLVLAVAAAPVALTSCAVDAGTEQKDVATVSMPLRVTHGGVTYALINARLTFTGTTSTTYNTNPADVAFNLSIAPGSYVVQLETGWQLQKIENGATTTLSEAVLTSQNPVSITVVEQQVAPLTFAFDITGTAIKFGEGGVQVGIEVCDVPGTCNQTACEPTATSFGYSPVAAEYMHAGTGILGRVAQTVNVASAIAVATVTLPLFSCKQNGIVDARLSLTHATATGLPDMSQLVAQALVPSGQIAGSCVAGDVFQPASFDFGGVSLPPGQYALVLEAVGNNAGGLNWRRSSTPADIQNPYPAGTPYEENVGGNPPWQPFSAVDLAFTIDGVEPCE